MVVRDRIAALLPLALLAACAGGPGVKGVEADRLFRRYSGTWVLDPEASDPLGNVGTETARSGGVRPSGDPFGGGFPAGRRGGPGGGVGGRGRGGSLEDPRAVRAILALARIRPERLRLEVDDSSFVTSDARGRRAAVPLDGEEVELAGEVGALKARVRWKDRVPTLERSIDGGGRIADRFEIDESGRLVVTRRVQPRRGRGVEIRSVYERAETTESRDNGAAATQGSTERGRHRERRSSADGS